MKLRIAFPGRECSPKRVVSIGWAGWVVFLPFLLPREPRVRTWKMAWKVAWKMAWKMACVRACVRARFVWLIVINDLELTVCEARSKVEQLAQCSSTTVRTCLTPVVFQDLVLLTLLRVRVLADVGNLLR